MKIACVSIATCMDTDFIIVVLCVYGDEHLHDIIAEVKRIGLSKTLLNDDDLYIICYVGQHVLLRTK